MEVLVVGSLIFGAITIASKALSSWSDARYARELEEETRINTERSQGGRGPGRVCNQGHYGCSSKH